MGLKYDVQVFLFEKLISNKIRCLDVKHDSNALFTLNE